MREPGAPLRVLLVEDSENDALLLLRELRRGGYEPLYELVSTSEEMERALGEASSRGEPWEVVVSDYYMPRFGALAALELLQRLGYDTPFVVVSGKIGEDAAVAMMRAGAQDYVAKEDMLRLCPAIERELREAEELARRAALAVDNARLYDEAQKEISERKRAETRFRTLVEQIPAVTYIQSPYGTKPMEYVSPQIRGHARLLAEDGERSTTSS